MTDSISFDRAAEYYDQTRAAPDSVMAQLIPALTKALPRGEACLEIGVGTGRIALPLAEAGVRLIGIDISPEMLRKLTGKRRGAWPLLAIGDATRLPFATATFGSAIASHVLHLIPEWRRAVAEMVRVVRPGGAVAASRGSRLKGGWRDQVSGRFFKEAGDPPWPPGMDGIDELDATMSAIGAEVVPFPDLTTQETSSIESLIAAMEEGIWAACWSLDQATRRRAARVTREWARRELGDLDVARTATAGSVWRVYRLPE
jgi:SAM-dependent methyltransferase